MMNSWKAVYLTEHADTTADKLKARVVANETTYFVRFGDAEIRFLAKLDDKSKTQHNCKQLQRELRALVKINDPRFMIAPGIGLDVRGYPNRFRHRAEIEKKTRKALPKYMEWRGKFANPHALTLKFIYDPDWFLDFCQRLRQRESVMLIAGKSLAASTTVQRLFGPSHVIYMPDSESYAELNKREDEIMSHAMQADTIVCILGPAGKAFAYRLWSRQWKGCLIKPGALVNALVGQKVRRWIRNFVPQAAIDRYQAEAKSI